MEYFYQQGCAIITCHFPYKKADADAPQKHQKSPYQLVNKKTSTTRRGGVARTVKIYIRWRALQ